MSAPKSAAARWAAGQAARGADPKLMTAAQRELFVLALEHGAEQLRAAAERFRAGECVDASELAAPAAAAVQVIAAAVKS